MTDFNFPRPAIELTPDDKAYAGLAQAWMTCTWWMGPRVISVTKKQSRLAAFHGLQALFWQIIFTVVHFTATMGFMVVCLSTIAIEQPSPSGNQPFPIALLITLPFFWLFIMGSFAATLSLAILCCLKAMRGEWAGDPVIGSWARRIVCG